MKTPLTTYSTIRQILWRFWDT